jgi:excisionase family DNA binding protein
MAARSRRPPQTPAPSASAPQERLAYGVDEAAACLGLSRATIYREVEAGRLMPKKCGRRTLFTREELLAFVRSLPQSEKS